jgi:hypothetical protein
VAEEEEIDTNVVVGHDGREERRQGKCGFAPGAPGHKAGSLMSRRASKVARKE